VNQVENIYWSLVSSYEDLQAKERALEQSKKVAGRPQAVGDRHHGSARMW
jgi:outer membrane protein